LEGVQYKNYEVIEFSSDMANLIARAKLVISRPGASSIFEIASIGKSAIFIPISPLVTAHQAVNAAYLEKNGYAKVFSQDKKSSVLLKMIQSSLAEKDTSISKLGFPLSGEKISQIILDEIQAIKFKKNVKKVHLIGIGGVSMSAIGKLLTQIKITVSGSDIRLGGHQEENVSIDTDLVAFSSAAGESSKAKPEHIRARQLEIPILRRAQLISEIAGNKSIIAVSGMHGKTTISSLISRMLEKSGYNPSFLIGAQSTPANPTAHIGHGEHFVIEACEYDDSFLDLAPEIALISNIEREHLDYFKGGLTQIKEHFGLFVSRIRPGGALVYCYDSQSVRDVIKDCQGLISSRNISVFSYGTDRECDFYLNKYSVSGGRAKFAIKNKKLGETEFASQITGEHFALNVAGALAVGAYLGLSSSPIASVAQTFQGANRRFNFVGKTNSGALVYDDYGHHPTELMYTLRALSEKFPKEEKTVVFQPHQQSRFNEFYGDFEKVFSDLDEINIILLPVFRVEGRDERASHSSAELVEKLSKTKQAKYFQTYSQASDYLENQLHSGDIVITIGATSVNKVGENLIKNN
jgi:UDP-N-acetylmuramate--alanine ligase